MSWAITGVSAGLAIAGGISANQQASANAKATAMQLLQNFNVQQNNLQNQAIDLNNQIGMELSKAKFNSMKSIGNVNVMLANKNIAGATSTRLHNNVSMQEALTTDAIIQAGEAKMTEVQTNLTSSFMQYKQGLFQNEINRQNNTKSGFEIAVSAATAGMQGYSMGQNIISGVQTQKAALAAANMQKSINTAAGLKTTEITPFSYSDLFNYNMFK